jgi:hypothetical protein
MSLLDEFDKPGPLHSRWGTGEELAILRSNVRSFSEKLYANDGISPIGRFLIKRGMIEHLRNRAQTIKFYEANRSFIEGHGKYDNPVIVTGFPRTGTTLLQRLMSEDPNTRSPYAYELEKTIPPLLAGADPGKDPRIKTSAAPMATLRKIAPGFIETEMTAELSEEVRKQWADSIPLKRGGTPVDVANVAVFLASEMSAYVNGQVINVCGGMRM